MNVRLPKPEPKETEVSLGNLYDMNKQIMLNESVMTQEEIEETIKKMAPWFAKYASQHYYMLLCNERRDYTLFNIKEYDEYGVTAAQTMLAAKDVLECMVNRGELLSVDLLEDDAWELWAKIEDECFVYYLFPYGQAVLEY